MRLDHIAYRVSNRERTASFFLEAFGYRLQQEFTIDFGNGQSAQCIALEPPEKVVEGTPWNGLAPPGYESCAYHLAPEVFVSDGSPGSIVGDWVAARGGVGGIHHLAYQVENVEQTMRLWQQKGYAEFTSESPLRCPGITQVFTRPSELTGIIYEFIERGEFGFCKDNVRALMESTRGIQ